MDDVTKRILVEILIKSEDAVKELNRFRTDVNKTKAALRELRMAGLTLGQANTKLEENFRGLKSKSQDLDRNLAVLSQSTEEVGQEMNTTGSSTLKLANIVERVFAAAIIGVALNALRQFVNGLKEAAEAGAELSRSLLDIQVSARALQRSGLETTVGEWVDLADELDKTFTQFGRTDINKGVAQLLDLGRAANLSSEEILRMADAVAILATKEGLAFYDAVDKLSQPIGTGRTHALRDLVETMKETSVAQEAIRRGFAETEDDVDEYVRAITALAIMEERVVQVGEDSLLIQQALSGQYKETTEDILDAKAAIGEQLLPIVIKLQTVWAGVLGGLELVILAIQQAMAIIFASVTTTMALLIAPIVKFRELITGEFDLATFRAEVFGEAFADAVQFINPGLFNDLAAGVDEVSGALEDGIEPIEDYAEAIEDLMIDLREAMIDVQEDKAKENRKFQQDMIEDEIKFQNDLKQLYDKLQFDIAKVNRTYNDDLEDANEEYRNKEIKAEEDFQEKLRKLREKFLFDLEEALHERDARQILRLIRQFNMRKAQLGREKTQEQQENQRRLAQDRRDAKDRRDERIRELQLGYERRRAVMLEEYELEKELRKTDHENRLEEITIRGNERNQEILRKFQDQYDITVEMAAAIRDALMREFGPGGNVDAIYSYLISLMQAAVQAAQIGAGIARSIPAPSFGRTESQQTVYPFAEGGTLVAKRPTLAMFGEAGPEVAKFAPLNRPGTNVNKVFGGSLPGGDQAFVKMEVLLSPDLELRVMDKTIGVVANVIEGRL